MVKKKDKDMIVWGVLIVFLLVVAYNFGGLDYFTQDEVAEINGNPVTITATYLDDDGNPVYTEKLTRAQTQAVFGGSFDLDNDFPSVILTFTVTNSGNVPITIDVTSAEFAGTFTT